MVRGWNGHFVGSGKRYLVCWLGVAASAHIVRAKGRWFAAIHRIVAKDNSVDSGFAGKLSCMEFSSMQLLTVTRFAICNLLHTICRV